MAMFSTWILSIKLLLISTGIVSIAMFLKFSFPLVTQFLCYQVPVIWYFIVSLLKPPYLYFVINFIILIIAISSRNHDKPHESSESQPLDQEVLVYHHHVVSREVVYSSNIQDKVQDMSEYDDQVDEVSPEVVKSVVLFDAHEVARQEEEVAVSRSAWIAPQRSKSIERLPEGVFPIPEKVSMVSKRIVRAPKTTLQVPDVKPLKLSNPDENETLDNTWKAIMESRKNPLKRCDEEENHNRPPNPIQSNPSMKKSATFRDRTNYSPLGILSPSPKKELSQSQDDLNRRVEAFIKKFNDDMRLQKQESLNRYMDAIKRGVY